MKTSDNGIDFIIGHESIVLHAYDDKDPLTRPIQPGDAVSGTLTIGAGHTGPDVVPGMTITSEQATVLLMQDLQWAENKVKSKVVVPLKQPQFDALVSHTFNTGGSDTLFSLVNQGAPVPATKSWWVTTYVTSLGEFMQGLKNRRIAEWELFSSGIYPEQKKKY